MFAVMRVDKRFYLPGKMEREAELEMEKNERGVVERTPSERSK